MSENTIKHIERVQTLLSVITLDLYHRGLKHDNSKLHSPEAEAFKEVEEQLAGLTYGSDEYRAQLKKLKPAIEHHYANNSHHPEHYADGIHGMDLLDIVEMFCDWKAASERHNDGDFKKSIEHNKGRFKMSDELAAVFENTRKNLSW